MQPSTNRAAGAQVAAQVLRLLAVPDHANEMLFIYADGRALVSAVDVDRAIGVGIWLVREFPDPWEPSGTERGFRIVKRMHSPDFYGPIRSPAWRFSGVFMRTEFLLVEDPDMCRALRW